MSACDVSAHEIGHNWNADHCTCSSPASTMNPSITSINRFTFSGNLNTISQITGFRGDSPSQRSCIALLGSDTGPLNDRCIDPRTISTGRFGFSTVGSGTEAPPPNGCDTGSSIENDIWFKYIAPCDGTLTLSTCENAGESGFDTVLVVYRGECSALVLLACND